MKAWHMLLVVLGLVDQVFSHEQTCVSPKGEVGDYIVKNCKVKYCQEREDRHFGRWRTVSKYGCCVLNGTKYEPNTLMSTKYDDNGCNIVELYCGEWGSTEIRTNETCCAAAPPSTPAPSTAAPSTAAPSTPEPVKEKAILLTGGLTVGGSSDQVEVLNSDGSYLCNLTPLLGAEYGMSLIGTLACGGWTYSRSCFNYTAGRWDELSFGLLDERRIANSFENDNGIILMAGTVSSSVELLTSEGSELLSHSYTQSWTCGIPMDQQIVIIGGRPEFNLAQIWDQSGLVETLPDLNEGRTGPACGQYEDDMYGQVFVVAGGFGGSDYLSSTEVLFYGDGADAWDPVGEYPIRVWMHQSASIDNNIIVAGGYGNGGDFGYHNLVCKFNKMTLGWDVVGYLKEDRNYSGVSVINKEDVEDYCLSSDQLKKPVHKKFSKKFVDPNVLGPKK